MWKYIINLIKPKSAEQAAVIKFRLAVAYAFLGWNAFILMFYRAMDYHLPQDPIERRGTIINKLTPNTDKHIIRVHGFNVVENRTVSSENYSKEVQEQQSMEE